MTPLFYLLLLKAALVSVIASSALVIFHAILSAKALGGTLGKALKKIAAGTTVHLIVFVTYLLLERGERGMLTDEQIRLFFMTTGLFGSILLFSGFFQLYGIAKKLKLFTV